MKYFKSKTGDVFAYTKSQLETVANIDNPDYEFPIPREFYDLRDKLTGMTELTEAHLAPKPPTFFEKIAEVQAPFLEQQTLAKSDFITARIEGDAEFEAEAQADYQASIDAMKQATSEVTGG